MHHPFFVYGTLKPGEPNYIRLLAGHTTGEESAIFPTAALYTAGTSPFMVTDQDLVAPGDQVSGTIISVADTDYPQILTMLDQLEGYQCEGMPNTYERLLLLVETSAGPRQAWVYLAGREALNSIRDGQLRKLPDGNWQSDAAAVAYWRNQ
ncbi:MAG: gamma-glutamylcyclotransferase [Oscillochloris sp.]|nr:gamma-glutamylcyclotransferase [Oscillochloris sp.]